MWGILKLIVFEILYECTYFRTAFAEEWATNFFSTHPMMIIQSALSPHECVEHLRYPQCYSNTSRKFLKPFLSKKFQNPIDSPQYHCEMFSANFALEGASKLENHHHLTFWLVKSN